jgi:WD40 repeat protein
MTPRPPRIVELMLGASCPMTRAPAGDELARIMQDLPAETTCPVSRWSHVSQVALRRAILPGERALSASSDNTLRLWDLASGETLRGYEIGKGQYLQVEDDELEKIEIESTHTSGIDL